MNPAALRGALTDERRVAIGALVVGLLAMYVPVIWDASFGLWNSEDQAHGPIVVAVSLWWAWTRRAVFRAVPDQPVDAPAWALLLFGTATYVIGRSQQVWMLQIGSAIPVLAGSIAILFGRGALRDMRFAILFLVFAIPLPGSIVDELTAPLKRGVSVAAEDLLYLWGYPVARDGVVITLGQYKLLVADACSGLYSMTSLLALTVLYVNGSRRAGALRNAFLILASVPFAFAANVMRVLLLALITYHLGDAAGQGFLHGSAGVTMFLTAVACLVVTDLALGGLGRRLDAVFVH